MNETLIEQIHADASALDIKITTQEIALYLSENKVPPEHLEALKEFMVYLRQNQRDKAISTLLQHSRIPQKEPSTFENFDFSRVTGEHAAQIKSLPNLTALYSRQNIAFIGPPGVGKTHLSMAYGNSCCHKGLKAYFIKATELNEKFTKARRTGTESSAVSGLVRPSCLLEKSASDFISTCHIQETDSKIPFSTHTVVQTATVTGCDGDGYATFRQIVRQR